MHHDYLSYIGRGTSPRQNRGGVRFYVLGKDRGTHPPFAPCTICQTKGGNLQGYSDEEVVSHDHNAIPSTPLDSSASILLLSSDIDVVGIDEAQFFDEGLVDVCNQLAYRGVRVIIAGLDMDFRGVPFGPMPALCAIADDVTKVHAICVKCGSLAYVSHRTVKNDKRVLLGETQEYEPLCRDCYLRAIEEEKAKDEKTSQ